MKIEDIYYELPTNHIAPEKFDRDKWVQENPIDYFIFFLLQKILNQVFQMKSHLGLLQKHFIELQDYIFQILYINILH